MPWLPLIKVLLSLIWFVGLRASCAFPPSKHVVGSGNLVENYPPLGGQDRLVVAGALLHSCLPLPPFLACLSGLFVRPPALRAPVPVATTRNVLKLIIFKLIMIQGNSFVPPSPLDRTFECDLMGEDYSVCPRYRCANMLAAGARRVSHDRSAELGDCKGAQF